MLPTSQDKLTNHSDGGRDGSEEHVLVMQFMRNSIVSNPITVSDDRPHPTPQTLMNTIKAGG